MQGISIFDNQHAALGVVIDITVCHPLRHLAQRRGDGVERLPKLVDGFFLILDDALLVIVARDVAVKVSVRRSALMLPVAHRYVSLWLRQGDITMSDWQHESGATDTDLDRYITGDDDEESIIEDQKETIYQLRQALDAVTATLRQMAQWVADGDVYYDSKGGMLIVKDADALHEKARALVSYLPAQ